MDSIWESKKLATGDFVVEEPKKKKKLFDPSQGVRIHINFQIWVKLPNMKQLELLG